jgi:hypothetical protein
METERKEAERLEKLHVKATWSLLGVTVLLFIATVWLLILSYQYTGEVIATRNIMANVSQNIQTATTNLPEVLNCASSITQNTEDCATKLETANLATAERFRYDRLARRLDAIWNHINFYSETGLPALERYCELNDKKKPTILRTWLDYAFYEHNEAEKQLYEGKYDEAITALNFLEFWYKTFVEDYQENAKDLRFDAIVETSSH